MAGTISQGKVLCMTIQLYIWRRRNFYTLSYVCSAYSSFRPGLRRPEIRTMHPDHQVLPEKSSSCSGPCIRSGHVLFYGEELSGTSANFEQDNGGYRCGLNRVLTRTCYVLEVGVRFPHAM